MFRELKHLLSLLCERTGTGGYDEAAELACQELDAVRDDIDDLRERLSRATREPEAGAGSAVRDVRLCVGDDFRDEAIYVDGVLKFSGSTVYQADIVQACGEQPCVLRHHLAHDTAGDWPKDFADLQLVSE